MSLDLDPQTHSNYHIIKSTHVHLDWTIDFEAQTVSGTVVHDLEVVGNEVPNQVIFDTSALSVKGVTVNGQSGSFVLGPSHPVMGEAMSVSLPSTLNLQLGSKVKVGIEYSTTENCTALQWLDKEQTQGKQHPYLFSQCQSIYARSLLPVMDSPSVKITYSANVKSNLPVLLSAIRDSPPADGPAHDGKTIGKDIVGYKYNQPVPIPSYLIAIAAGNLRYRAFSKVSGKSWTTGVWAEPELIDSAFWEFSEDTGRFLAAEESIVSPYRFGVYDLLVLPPSFPYGGMENACLSFLTPTLLTGDRSLVDVVVHELTHSWFGNGVTHAHASHFWLNEGFTTYIERVLQQKLHGPAERGFSCLIGSKGLYESLKFYQSNPKYQQLVIEFDKGEDPEDAYSQVPYEKGSNFLLYLEKILGGLDVFLPYVRDYVETYMGKSITTEQWKSHLYAYWNMYDAEKGTDKVKKLDSIDWNGWLYGQGEKLPVEPEYDLTLAEESYKLAAKWDASRSSPVEKVEFDEQKDLGHITNGNQIVVFLERLHSYPTLPASHLLHLAKTYKSRISDSPNAEIRLRFYRLILSDPDNNEAAKAHAQDAVDWVVGKNGGVIKGRMKFCRPVFRDVGKVDLKLAQKAFQSTQREFHPIARRMIEKDLGLP